MVVIRGVIVQGVIVQGVVVLESLLNTTVCFYSYNKLLKLMIVSNLKTKHVITTLNKYD